MTTASAVTPFPNAPIPVQTFKTPDGCYFATEAEALQHMARDKFEEQAQAYIDSLGWDEEDRGAKAQATRIKNAICNYLAWVESQK